MWETSVLFCFFVVITLLWEFITALLAFITVRQTGRKAIWISRLKNEVLALGVITLVLSVAQSTLQKICVCEFLGLYLLIEPFDLTHDDQLVLVPPRQSLATRVTLATTTCSPMR